jgi:hypothetical protein
MNGLPIDAVELRVPKLLINDRPRFLERLLTQFNGGVRGLADSNSATPGQHEKGQNQGYSSHTGSPIIMQILHDNKGI